MASMNSLLPRFSKASANGVSEEGWGDVDTMDVEMLAEYLLDDGNVTANGVTFDFNVDKRDSSMVSPESSEDGRLPPVADTATSSVPTAVVHDPTKVYSQAITTSQQPMVAPAPTTMAQTLAAFPTLPAAIPNLGAFGMAGAPGGALVLPQQQQHVQMHGIVDGNDAKRRRVDPSGAMMAMAGLPGQPMMAGQQLAVSAAAAAFQQASQQAQQQQTQGRARKKSQAQIDRRRERNRILAKRTRLRKKFFFESLQKEVMDLQRENQTLKEIVKVNLDEEASKKILDECDAMEKMPEGVLEACNENGEELDQQDFSLVQSIQKSQHAFIITDPSLQDNPIVFASEGFLSLTGYTREQVLGRNCRFLQGNDTSKEKIETIRKAVSSGEDVSVTLLNYTADGHPFWNKLFIAALRDAHNNIVNYIGVTVKVSSPEPGDAEFGKTLPGEKADEEFDDDDGTED